MSKSANDVMQQIVFGAVVDTIAALRADAKGVPNNLLRDIASINGNALFSDLPKSVQQAIRASTMNGFKLLLKEGYAIGPRAEVRPSRNRRPPRRKPSTA